MLTNTNWVHRTAFADVEPAIIADALTLCELYFIFCGSVVIGVLLLPADRINGAAANEVTNAVLSTKTSANTANIHGLLSLCSVSSCPALQQRPDLMRLRTSAGSTSILCLRQ